MKPLSSRVWWRIALAIGIALPLAVPAGAQDYPSRPLRMIVPFPAGGGGDVTARVVARKLEEQLGQSVVVDNKPGGNAVIGAQELVKAQPDGYTLLWSIDQTYVLNQALYRKLPYDPRKDFAPVTLTIASPIVLVTRADSGIGSVADLVARARAEPGKVNAGVAAMLAHVAQGLFDQSAGVRSTRIPYKGSSELATGTMAGDVDLAFDGIAPFLQFARSGRARVLASTAPARLAAMPDVPTLTELGFRDMSFGVWFAVAAPAGTPQPVIDRLNSAFSAALDDPGVRERLATFGFEPVAQRGPAAMAQRMEADLQRFGPVARALGLQLD